MRNQIKLKSDMSASQSEPFIQKIATMDGLHTCIVKHYNMALNKFRLILIICEQNGLQYWVNRDFRIANKYFNDLMDSRTETNSYDITTYKN